MASDRIFFIDNYQKYHNQKYFIVRKRNILRSNET